MDRFLLALLLAGCAGPSAGTPERGLAVPHDSRGRWGVSSPTIEHWLYDPDEKRDRDPSNGGAKSSLYRDSLPFPQFSWGSGDFQVTQLVFPVAGGLIARYHVMNHGSEPRSVRLLVGSQDGSTRLPALVPASAPTEKSDTRLAFDLKIEAGASQFVVLGTPEAAGRDPVQALDEATARWEKLMARTITISDPEALSAYCRDLAGRALGTPGCAEAVRKLEERFVRREGDALRLLGEVPEPWLLDAIEVSAYKSDFGALSFRHVGFYNNRTLDLEPGCAPPGGFLMPVGSKHKAKIDGKDAEAKDGLLRIPSGTKRVELTRPY